MESWSFDGKAAKALDIREDANMIAPSAERRAPSAERRAPSAERRAPSAASPSFRRRSGAASLPKEPATPPLGFRRGGHFRAHALPALLRRPAMGLLALLSGFALLSLAPAEAQTTTAGVSNLGQTDDGFVGFTTAGGYFANSFRIGGASSDRHTLSHVVFHFHSGGNGATVGIYEDSSGNPSTTQVGSNLTQVGSASSGQVRFNASGVTLNGNTTYWLRVYKGSTWNAHQTQSTAEDSSSTDGWSIANVRRHSTNGTSWSTLANATPLRFSVSTTLPDTTAPTVHWARVSADGATVHIQFSENMDATAKAPNNAFTVLVEGAGRTVSSYSLSGSTATLTLASAVTEGQHVTVDYTKPDSGTALQDLAGNKLETTGARLAVVLDGRVRVSNLGETTTSHGQLRQTTPTLYTSFTTGARHGSTDIDYFVLDNVVMYVGTGAERLRLHIHADRAGDAIAELQRSGSAGGGNITFNAPTGAKRVILKKNTTYWLAISRRAAAGGGGISLGRTHSENETNLRAPDGWSIGTNVLPKTGSAIWGESIRLAVNASVIWRPLAPRAPGLAGQSDAELQGSHYAHWVTNLARTESGDEAPAAGDAVSSKFSTGAGINGAAYTLDEVTIDFDSGAGNATVGIYTDSSGNPGTQVGGNLARTSTGASGNQTFSPIVETITLNAGTKYHVVVTRPSGASALTVDTNTALLSAAREWGRSTRSSDWNIANKLRKRTGGTWSEVSETLRMKVEATLTGLVPNAVVTTMEGRYSYGGINVPDTNATGAVRLASNSFKLSGDSSDRFTVHRVDVALNGNTSYAHRVVILADDGTGAPDLSTGEGGTSAFAEQVGPELVARPSHIHQHSFFWSLPDRWFGSHDYNAGVNAIYDVPSPGITLNGGTTYHLVLLPQANPVNPGTGRTVTPFLAFPTVKTADALIGRWGGEVGSYRVSTDDVNTTNPFPGDDSATLEVNRYSRSLKFAIRATNIERPSGAGGRSGGRPVPEGGAGIQQGGEGHTAAPDAVANVNVTHNGASLSVSWDAPARAETYDVTYYNAASRVNARAAWERAGTSLTIACDSRNPDRYENCVDAGAAYTVGVRARNDVGESAWTNSARVAAPQAPASAPAPVAEVRVTHNGSSLSVSWDAPARATHYDVTYTDAAATAWQRAAWNRAGSGIRISANVDGNAPINGAKSYIVGVRARNAAGESAWTNSEAASRQEGGFGRLLPRFAHAARAGAARTGGRSGGDGNAAGARSRAAAWLFPSASDATRTGAARVANRSDAAGTVTVTATDDAGRAYPPLALALDARAVVRFDVRDMEMGNPAIGLSGATGPGTGDWRLEFASELDIEVRAYARTADGRIAAMDATAPADEGGALRVPIFNPASDIDQRGLLRLVNPGAADAVATVAGIDDLGRSSGAEVVLTVPAGAACTLDAPQLESGAGLACGLRQRGLGDGHGRWRLTVASDGPLVAMSLLSAPDGRLANLSGVPAAAEGPVRVPLFPAASDPHGRLGLVRVVNRSNRAGAVAIEVSDDSGAAYPAPILHLAAGAAVDLDAWDLELGNPAKGLSGATGTGVGSWRLALSSDDIEFDALAYAQAPDGFLTPVWAAAPSAGGAHHVAHFESRGGVLRLANAGMRDALVSVFGTDDLGRSPGGAVRVAVPAGTAVELTAAELESGAAAAIVSGALGDGAGAWRLRIAANAGAVSAMSLLLDPSGSLTNLSGPPPGAKPENPAPR